MGAFFQESRLSEYSLTSNLAAIPYVLQLLCECENNVTTSVTSFSARKIIRFANAYFILNWLVRSFFFSSCEVLHIMLLKAYLSCKVVLLSSNEVLYKMLVDMAFIRIIPMRNIAISSSRTYFSDNNYHHPENLLPAMSVDFGPSSLLCIPLY